MLIFGRVRVGGGRTYIGYVNIVGPGKGVSGVSTEIMDFILLEGWFRAGGLKRDSGDVTIGGGGGGRFGDRY